MDDMDEMYEEPNDEVAYYLGLLDHTEEPEEMTEDEAYHLAYLAEEMYERILG